MKHVSEQFKYSIFEEMTVKLESSRINMEFVLPVKVQFINIINVFSISMIDIRAEFSANTQSLKVIFAVFPSKTSKAEPLFEKQLLMITCSPWKLTVSDISKAPAFSGDDPLIIVKLYI